MIWFAMLLSGYKQAFRDLLSNHTIVRQSQPDIDFIDDQLANNTVVHLQGTDIDFVDDQIGNNTSLSITIS